MNGRALNWGINSSRTLQGNDLMSALPQSGQTVRFGEFVVPEDSHRCLFSTDLIFMKCTSPLVPFCILKFIYSMSSWNNCKGFRWFLAVQDSWLACNYGGSVGYSHSKIFKAGEVICETSRLASENLLRWKVKYDIKLIVMNNMWCTNLTNKWITSYWTLGGPKVLETGEAHFCCKVRWKLVRLKVDAVIILANIILSSESEKCIFIMYINILHIFQPIKPSCEIKKYTSCLHYKSSALWVSHRQLLPPHVRLPGLWLQNEHASWPEVSVDSLKEPLEATVSPVQMNPFGNTQAHDHVVLWPLSQK